MTDRSHQISNTNTNLSSRRFSHQLLNCAGNMRIKWPEPELQCVAGLTVAWSSFCSSPLFLLASPGYQSTVLLYFVYGHLILMDSHWWGWVGSESFGLLKIFVFQVFIRFLSNLVKRRRNLFKAIFIFWGNFLRSCFQSIRRTTTTSNERPHIMTSGHFCTVAMFNNFGTNVFLNPAQKDAQHFFRLLPLNRGLASFCQYVTKEVLEPSASSLQKLTMHLPATIPLIWSHILQEI